MRISVRTLSLVCLVCCTALSASAARNWAGVHPHWRDAYVFSFRSADLLTNEADERWGRQDDRLVCGGVLSDLPAWLKERQEDLADARRDGRPILLSLHLHSGYGTGLVTYTDEVQTAEVANYPWLVRTLTAANLGGDEVTVAVDTCNAQATAAHQLRPDLIPGGVEAWSPFAQWRRASAVRRRMPLGEAYTLFARDRVAAHLNKPARGNRGHVHAAEYRPLSADERRAFRAHLYGQRGVILATPAFFNLLRLGPEPRNTLTADLMRGKLDGTVVDSLLERNMLEFRRFQTYGFLAAAGVDSEPLADEAETRDRGGSRNARAQRSDPSGD